MKNEKPRKRRNRQEYAMKLNHREVVLGRGEEQTESKSGTQMEGGEGRRERGGKKRKREILSGRKERGEA